MMLKNKLLLEKIRKDIDLAEVVSFDIFDTLLLRPYIKPVDLFTHIEKTEKKPFFAASRQQAEHNARIKRSDVEDITFDDIYNEIDSKFKPLKQVELDFENMVLMQNPELKQVFDYALKMKKKVVIISDMYLPDDFIKGVLKKNGFSGYLKCYISGTVGKTKTTSNLYKIMMQDLKIDNPKQVIHIGDNKVSDFKKPKKLGIKAVLYKQVLQQFKDKNRRIRNCLESKKTNLGMSILTAYAAIKWQYARCNNQQSDYWSSLGYWYAGPLAYGYCRFVQREVTEENLSSLLFVARDGYMLQKVLNVFDPKIKSHYIYAPRILNLIYRLDYNRKSLKQTQLIVDKFCAEDENIKKLYAQVQKHDAKSNHKFIQENIKLFSKIAEKGFEKYKNYIGKFVKGNSSKVGIVDTITGEFSSQRLIQSALPCEVCGLYWGVLLLSNSQTNYFWHKDFVLNDKEIPNGRDVFTANWNFIEFLITSPEYPIAGLTDQGQPIYVNPTASEKLRAKIYPSISDAAVMFVKDMENLFHKKDIFLDGQTLINWVNSFIDYPDKIDIDFMQQINVGIDSGHTDYVPLFVSNLSLKDIVKHPIKSIKIIKSCVWKTKAQRLFLVLSKPISFNMKGLRIIKLVFLPTLERQYLCLNITPIEKWSWKVILGNAKR